MEDEGSCRERMAVLEAEHRNLKVSLERITSKLDALSLSLDTLGVEIRNGRREERENFYREIEKRDARLHTLERAVDRLNTLVWAVGLGVTAFSGLVSFLFNIYQAIPAK